MAKGVVSYSLSKIDEAMDSFQSALEIKPNNPDFYKNMGNLGNILKAIFRNGYIGGKKTGKIIF